MTTPAAIHERLRQILDCEHGDISIGENHDEMVAVVSITETAIEESMFDLEQIDQIVGGLMPLPTAHAVEVR